MITKSRTLLLLLLTGLLLFPFAYLWVLSVADSWRFPFLLPTHLSLANWRQLFATQGGLTASFLLSGAMAMLVSVVSTVAGFLASKAIAYHPNRRRFLLVTYFPFLLSPVIYAVCLYIYFVYLNLAGRFTGVLIGQLILAFPFSVILLSGFWNQERKSLEDLVATLGGNSWQTFTRVLLPMARGPLLVCFFQTFLLSWFEYGLTNLIGLGQVPTLTIRVYQYINEANASFAALSSCLLVMPPALLIWVNKRFVFRQVE